MPDPSAVRRHKGLVRHTLHQLLHVDLVRYGVAAGRFLWFAKVRRRLVTVAGNSAVAEHTVHHNLRGLRDLAVNRSLYLVRPLSTVERLQPDSPLLVVGPRTEGELLALLAHGFDRSALHAVDLISYSPWVQAGDLHDLPFGDDGFDAVMLGWVLAYSEDPARAAAEVVRVARHGAVVAVGVEWNPVPDEEIVGAHGYVPGAGHRITSVDQVLGYFGTHVGDVLVREDVPPERRNALGAIVVLFTVDKADGGVSAGATSLTAAAGGTAEPPVTVVLPTLDERRFLRDCLDSLLDQDYPDITEILVVDGGSADGTRSLAKGRDERVRVVDNPGVTAAAAMNLGLAEAGNDVIVRADAHTLYAPDYVSRSVRALRESGASWVGGPMRPVGLTTFGRAVAAVTSSPFGVGPGRFHYGTVAQDVDTVYLGTFDRRHVQAVGGYDEVHLQWAAEDQELNYRLRRAGHRIRLDPAIRSWYFPRQDPRGLAHQYFNYGMCKASTLKQHGTLPAWRPLAPAALVAGTAAWTGAAVLARRRRLSAVPATAYLAGAGLVAVRLARDPGVAPHRALGALAICHWAYGLGFWAGVGRILRGRPFDNRPRRR